MAHAVAFAAIRTTKTRENIAESSYATQLLVVAQHKLVVPQHKNCPSSEIDHRPGRDLFRVLKIDRFSTAHTWSSTNSSKYVDK